MQAENSWSVRSVYPSGYYSFRFVCLDYFVCSRRRTRVYSLLIFIIAHHNRLFSKVEGFHI